MVNLMKTIRIEKLTLNVGAGAQAVSSVASSAGQSAANSGAGMVGGC